MFQLDLTSRTPIHRQLTDGCKELIVAGVLKPGDRLPSVRELSSLLTINPNTVQKAYRELEQSGWINTAPGLGSFVGERQHRPDSPQVQSTLDRIVKLVQEVMHQGLSLEEVVARIEDAVKSLRRSDKKAVGKKEEGGRDA